MRNPAEMIRLLIENNQYCQAVDISCQLMRASLGDQSANRDFQLKNSWLHVNTSGVCLPHRSFDKLEALLVASSQQQLCEKLVTQRKEYERIAAGVTDDITARFQLMTG